MGTLEGPDAPANELEELVADLSASGPVVFVFGNGAFTTHLRDATRPMFLGPRERRWWHLEQGDQEPVACGRPEARWVLNVRLDQVARVRFLREASPLPSFPGEEQLVVRFEANGDATSLNCVLRDLYDGRQLRPERVRAWEQLRSRFGDRDESLVVEGALEPVAPAA